MVAGAPEGWHSITPRLFVEDLETEIAFLRDAFEARGTHTPGSPAELTIGDSMIMVGQAGARAAMRSSLYLYVEDADATFARAKEAGATVVEELRDTPYGDRRAMIEDPGGNLWQIATRR